MPTPAEPLRAVVADDEPLARRRICTLLAREPDFEVVAETGNGPDTVEAVTAHAPDVLFLDVRMPGSDGIEVLEEVGPEGVGAVVLVTAFDDYAVDAFEHRALDYVLKPVDEERFHDTVRRVRERLRERRSVELTERALRALAEAPTRAESASREEYLSRIAVRSTQKTTVVDVADIEWIEAAGNYVRLHTPSRPHLYRGTLRALEERLDPAAFVRIHRSTIVRLSAVKELEPYFHGDYSVTLRDGTRRRLSRTYRARLQAALGQGI